MQEHGLCQGSRHPGSDLLLESEMAAGNVGLGTQEVQTKPRKTPVCNCLGACISGFSPQHQEPLSHSKLLFMPSFNEPMRFFLKFHTSRCFTTPRHPDRARLTAHSPYLAQDHSPQPPRGKPQHNPNQLLQHPDITLCPHCSKDLEQLFARASTQQTHAAIWFHFIQRVPALVCNPSRDSQTQ